jgi:hypothetical protein
MNLRYVFKELIHQKRRTVISVFGLSIGIALFVILNAPTLSLVAGGLASYFMGRRMAKMKPAEILRRL